jgi:hypothetical protein
VAILARKTARANPFKVRRQQAAWHLVVDIQTERRRDSRPGRYHGAHEPTDDLAPGAAAVVLSTEHAANGKNLDALHALQGINALSAQGLGMSPEAVPSRCRFFSACERTSPNRKRYNRSSGRTEIAIGRIARAGVAPLGARLAQPTYEIELHRIVSSVPGPWTVMGVRGHPPGMFVTITS